MSARPPWRSTWREDDGRRRRAGGPLFTITPTPSRRQSRRELLWLAVTADPNAEGLAGQLTEACGWDEPPRYLIRDRDGAHGVAFIRRIRAMGIRDRPVSARSLSSPRSR